MKDKELELEENEASRTLGGTGECRVQGIGKLLQFTKKIGLEKEPLSRFLFSF